LSAGARACAHARLAHACTHTREQSRHAHACACHAPPAAAGTPFAAAAGTAWSASARVVEEGSCTLVLSCALAGVHLASNARQLPTVNPSLQATLSRNRAQVADAAHKQLSRKSLACKPCSPQPTEPCRPLPASRHAGGCAAAPAKLLLRARANAPDSREGNPHPLRRPPCRPTAAAKPARASRCVPCPPHPSRPACTQTQARKCSSSAWEMHLSLITMACPHRRACMRPAPLPQGQLGGGARHG